jgi:hypothetical protein
MRWCGAGTDARYGRNFHKVSKLIPWLFQGFGSEHRSGVIEMARGAQEIALSEFGVDPLPPAGKDPMRDFLLRIAMMEFEPVVAVATLAGVTTGVESRLSALCHPLALIGTLD